MKIRSKVSLIFNLWSIDFKDKDDIEFGKYKISTDIIN